MGWGLEAMDQEPAAGRPRAADDTNSRQKPKKKRITGGLRVRPSNAGDEVEEEDKDDGGEAGASSVPKGRQRQRRKSACLLSMKLPAAQMWTMVCSSLYLGL